MPKPDIVLCGDCRFWLKLNGHPLDPDLAYCHLEPRTVICASEAEVGLEHPDDQINRMHGCISIRALQARADGCSKGEEK